MTDEPLETRRKADGTFGPGNRANPAGRGKGTVNKTTRILQRLMEADAEQIVNVVVEGAKRGDWTAAKIILDRIVAPRKDNPVVLELPEVKTLEDASEALSVVIDAVSTGNISPSEGAQVTSLIREFSSAVEIQAIEKRLANLEALQEKK